MKFAPNLSSLEKNILEHIMFQLIKLETQTRIGFWILTEPKKSKFNMMNKKNITVHNLMQWNRQNVVDLVDFDPVWFRNSIQFWKFEFTFENTNKIDSS